MLTSGSAERRKPQAQDDVPEPDIPRPVGTTSRQRGWPWLHRLLVVVSAAVFVAGVLVAANHIRTQRQAVDLRDEVVARVDGEPVYVRDVEPHLRPELPWVGPTPPEHPVDSALRDAIIVRLVAAEAVRRGYRATGEVERDIADGQLTQALIGAELEARGFRPAWVTSDEVETFYEENRARISRFTGATVSAIVVGDQELAVELLRRVESVDSGGFRALVEEHSIDEDSLAADGYVADVDAAAENVPLEVARVAVSARSDGEFGLADTGDGRFWIVRVTDVQLAAPEWNAATEQRIRQLMEVDKRAVVIAELESQLRPDAAVRIDEEVLERFRALFATRMATPTAIP